MKKIFLLIFIAFGITAIIWGTKLVHHNYTHGRNIVYLWKAGEEKITPEVEASHSVQAAKDLVVHLGLIIAGTAIITFSLSSAFANYRKKHIKT